MKKKDLLLFIILSGISFSISAQKDRDSYEIGHYTDIEENLIEGYFDQSYAPEEPLTITYFMNNAYTIGRYYDSNFNRTEGYIEFSENTQYFHFKNSKNEEKQKVWAKDCAALVIGTDSFVVLNDVTFQGSLGAFKVEKPHFASVVDSYGPYTFYELYSSDLNNSRSTYLYSKNGYEQLISFPIVKSEFIKTASQAFQAFPALVKKINSYDYTRSDIPSLIKMLKYYLYFKDGAKIPFDENWNEIELDDRRTFFAEIVSVNDEAEFRIKYFFEKDTTLISEAVLTNLYPNKYADTTFYYYPNGYKRNEFLFEKGKAYRSISYHRNGKRHRISEIGNSNPYFENVYDVNGNSVFDKRGSGTELYYDSIRNLQIHYTYHKENLEEVYYTYNDKKIYQYCYANTRIKNKNYFEKLLNKEVEFSDSSLVKNHHGLVLLKLIVEPNGKFSEIELIKGIGKDCDEDVIAFMKEKNAGKIFSPGATYKHKITQEVILPVSFEIKAFSYYKNNYYYYHYPYLLHHQQIMWMHQNTINNIPAISY